jgi:phage-related baseplate assembly protein
MATVDLSQLPQPQIIETLDFEGFYWTFRPRLLPRFRMINRRL